MRFEHRRGPSLNMRVERKPSHYFHWSLSLSSSPRVSSGPHPPASPPAHRTVSPLVLLPLDELGSLLPRLTFSWALLPDVLCYSSRQILGLDEFKLLNGFGGELTATLAEIALLQALRAAVVLARSHYPVAATVRAPSVFSSHRSSLIWYMP